MAELILFILSLHIQLVFHLVVFSGILRHKENQGKPAYRSGASIIIAAHNELFNLRNLLPQLLQQEYTEYEIIVVNDRSDDGTYEYLSSAFVFHPIVKTIHITDVPIGLDPKKHALTKGIEAAENEILLFTDADCIPATTQWISEMAAPLQSGKKIVLGYSPYARKKGLLNQLIRFETFYTAVQYLSLAIAGNPYMGVGRNIAYTRSTFCRYKGFHGIETVTGGDDDLFIQRAATKHNVAIRLNPAAQTISLPKNTLSEWIIQKKRHLSVGKYYKTRNRFLLGLLTISHVLFYISFLAILIRGNWLIIGFIGYTLRTSVLIFNFTLISRKVSEKFSVISLPLLDFLYIINYMVVGFKAVVAGKSRWK